MSDKDAALSAEQRAAVERAAARAARRSQYPEDMGFMPYSGRFTNADVVLKTPWLSEYFKFRNRNPRADRETLRDVQQQIGADCSDIIDRFRGAMLGLAIGDALGTTLEFSPRDRATVTDIVGGGPFHLKPGDWTDDTSMACCLAYSLVHSHGFNPDHAMLAFSYWYRFGAYSPTGECFDIGGTTRAALDRYLKTGNAFSGDTHPNSAGNGSLMRLAPVVLFYAADFDKAVHFAAESSRLTHGAQEAVDACRFFAALMWGAFAGFSKEEILSDRFSPLPGYWDQHPLAPAVERIARGAYKQKTRDEISSSGYVIDTLEAALWAFYHNDDFESGMLAAVNLAGDADTIGAVFGQLAGASYGETRIPVRWIVNTHAAHGFYHFAEDLLAASRTDQPGN
ncbi:ADP-ribosylglycohydrolase family protein [Burkholderia aenigmatica]|uniref:ADP-ribosylglycohydrolase family protein n=1 Tax=Burkholderia aenigmatica TaxID=2015348 RepID=UPI002652D7FC|nr:ADP-ribosylglycohydrolase family protein [Burkholderia aenigmatica]MDN7879985.1 ADP-ribosylglycohydrolase family protein [Burkholderia aenigmatica]